MSKLCLSVFYQKNMSLAVIIAFCVLLSTETILICVGNTFTILVFWKKRRTLQRSYYLLINLALADVLLGLLEIIYLGTQNQPFLFTDSDDPSEKMTGFHYIYVLSSLQLLFSFSSVFSLAVISLERVYAVLWPLRHRTVNGRVYFGSIAFIWVAGSGAAVLHLLSFLHVLDPVYVAVAINTTLLSSLCVVCTSYVVIRNRLKHPLPIFDNQNRRNMERNLKLSKTLFIVIGLSLMCWTPAALLYPINFVCQNCIPQIVSLVAVALHLGNSIVNPVVYSYRMPMFKEELKRFLNSFNFLKHPGNEVTPRSVEKFDTPL